MAHRRWGKDDVGLHYTATSAMQRIGNYWHLLPEYSQARKVIWDAVNPRTQRRRIDDAFPDPIRKITRNQEMFIEFVNGSTWQLVGSDNYNSLVGSPPVGVVFSEWSLANPICWAYLEPVLVENDGWALFIYTSRGANHGKDTFDYAARTQGWFAEKNPAGKTPVYSEESLIGILDGLVTLYGPDMGKTIFNQDYMCSFEGMGRGEYYAKQIQQAREEGRICAVPHFPGIEVDTFWDLGVDDSMSIWFMQPMGKQYRFIDYYENSGYGLEHYAKVLKAKDYIYGNHHMPHDAEHREMTNSEIALSRKEVAENLGVRPVTVIPRARNFDIIINVHIPAVRNILSQCVFDEKKCAHGIKALEGYHAEWDEEKKVLGNRPKHDWHCHAADSFRVFAIGYTGRMKPIEMRMPTYQDKHYGYGWMF